MTPDQIARVERLREQIKHSNELLNPDLADADALDVLLREREALRAALAGHAIQCPPRILPLTGTTARTEGKCRCGHGPALHEDGAGACRAIHVLDDEPCHCEEYQP